MDPWYFWAYKNRQLLFSGIIGANILMTEFGFGKQNLGVKKGNSIDFEF
jgi:hypothetical protein